MRNLNGLFLIVCLLFSLGGFAQKNIKVDFLGQKIKANLICIASQPTIEESDAQAVFNINETLMGAIREAQFLDINIMMSKDTIKSDYLVFVIEVEQAQKLTLEMFDDGSFVMVADCTFSVNTGGNFLAVDVKNINKGVYNFRLKDEEGSEVNKRVVLSKKS